MKRSIITFLAVTLLTTMEVSSQSSGPSVWFLKAGANGDGSSFEKPLGSTAELEQLSQPNDMIILVGSETPLEGGLKLKTGQTLQGLAQGENRPILTNTDSVRRGGVGLILAGNNRVMNIEIRGTHATGILGENVTGNRIESVIVQDANVSSSILFQTPMGSVTHGGILLHNAQKGSLATNTLYDVQVNDVAGMGILTNAINGAESHLLIQNCQVKNGTNVGRTDFGIVVSADGTSSKVHLEIDSTRVWGRTSRGGRNVVIAAWDHATANAFIDRSHLGMVGQDGVLVLAGRIPARATLEVSHSLIENAGQLNVEGTILNMPYADSLRAAGTLVQIDIDDCIIRDAGVGNKVDYPGDILGAGNIWFGGSPTAQQMGLGKSIPLAPGRYQTTIRNSQISGAVDFEVGFGIQEEGTPPAQASFEARLDNNVVTSNGSYALYLAAAKASVKATNNCWGDSVGLADEKIRLFEPAKMEQIDRSEPQDCKQVILVSGND